MMNWEFQDDKLRTGRPDRKELNRRKQGKAWLFLSVAQDGELMGIVQLRLLMDAIEC